MGKLKGLDLWLSRGRDVVVGGRTLKLMPLPLRRLSEVGEWLRETSDDVVQEALDEMARSEKSPNVLELIGKVLNRIDTAAVAYEIFISCKHPETGNPINEGLTKEFFEDYLDLPAAKEVFVTFVDVNCLEEYIKNLQRLPAVQKLMGALATGIGLQFLNSLPQNTDSAQATSGGSQLRKSTDISKVGISEELESGTTKLPVM